MRRAHRGRRGLVLLQPDFGTAMSLLLIVALMIFAADKISRVRELRLEAARAHSSPERAARGPARKRRLAHYQRCLALLQERLPDSPLVRQLEVEVKGLLASSPPRPTTASRT